MPGGKRGRSEYALGVRKEGKNTLLEGGGVRSGPKPSGGGS